MKNHGLIDIRLTNDEGLVLFELINRLAELQDGHLILEHKAEYRALWRLETLLGHVLVEQYSPDYNERLDKARRDVQNAPA